MKKPLPQLLCIFALTAFAIIGHQQPKAQAADKIIMHLDFLINGYQPVEKGAIDRVSLDGET